MKLLAFLSALLLSQAAFASNLPGIIQARLRLKMAALDYQLALFEAPTLLKDKDFKAKSEAALEAYGKDPAMAGMMNLSSVGAAKALESAAAGSGMLANIMHAHTLQGKDLYPLFGPPFVVFTTGAFEIYTTKVRGVKAEYLVNDGKANGISMMAAKELSTLAALPPDAELAIKNALVKKIQEKVNSGDQTAIDPYKLLASVNAQDKKAISDQALAPFAAAAKTATNLVWPSEQELIRGVLAASALLKTGMSSGKIKKPDADRIEKLVAEIEYMANQAAAFRGADKPGTSPTAP